MKRFFAFMALGSLFFSSPLFAQYMLNFREADIRAVVQDVARVTGRTFVVDERVQSKISAVSERPLTRSEYFEVFLSTLRANGLVAIPISGGGYRIQPIANAASQPTRVGGSSSASASQLVTEVFRLRYAQAQDAVETLRPLVSPEGSVTANLNANSIVVADFADNVRRMRALIQQLDRDNSDSEIVALKNAGAREIAESLQALAQGGGERGPRVNVVAIDSSDSVAIRGDASEVARFVAMARQLDKEADSQAEIRVYWLEYADAQQLLPVLRQMLGQPSGPASEGPAFMNRASESISGAEEQPTPTPDLQSRSGSAGAGDGSGIARRGPAVVTRFEGGNAIIVAARPQVQKQMGELIRQLDSPRPQVLVEALVAELSTDAAKRLGVQFLLAGENIPALATSYSNAQPNILTVGAAAGAYELSRDKTVISNGTVIRSQDNPFGDELYQAAIQQIISANGGFGGAIIDIGKNAVFGAIVNAVQSDTQANILSTPSIMVLDNQPARMLVGQEVPVTTGEALSQNFENQFRTVERQNVGVQLEVKPQVNSSNTIKLYVRQEVSSIAGPVSSRSNDLILNKREFQTVLNIQDGQMAVIGGLIDENERRTIEKVPLLGDLPVIGELFKSRSRERGKTNLVVFIRPTIVASKADSDALTMRRYGYFRSGQQAANPDAEPGIDVLLRDYMGMRPPVETLTPGDTIYSADSRVMEVDADGDVVAAEPRGSFTMGPPQ